LIATKVDDGGGQRCRRRRARRRPSGRDPAHLSRRLRRMKKVMPYAKSALIFAHVEMNTF
jgi:hypothetical protein